MGRPPRVAEGGLIDHALNRANGRLSLFDDDGDYDAFLRVLAAAVPRYRVRLLAFCVMPNHFHLVLGTDADGELSRLMRWLTLTHTQRWHAHRHSAGSGHVYQGRFQSFRVRPINPAHRPPGSHQALELGSLRPPCGLSRRGNLMHFVGRVSGPAVAGRYGPAAATMRHCGPVGRRRGDPLVVSVGKAALEVRLERYGTAPQVPRSVFELRGQKEFDPPLVGRIGRRDGAGLFQGHQGLPRCKRITGERGKYSPTAVGSLLPQQVAGGVSSEGLPVLSRPAQAEKLKGPVLGLSRPGPASATPWCA